MFGVSEPNVQINKTAQGNYQISVELAGVKDVNQAIKMIGETPLLQFKELNEERKELTDEEKLGQYKHYPGTNPNATTQQVLAEIERSIASLKQSDLVDLFKPEPVQPVDSDHMGRIEAL